MLSKRHSFNYLWFYWQTGSINKISVNSLNSTLIVLVARKTDWFQDEICLERRRGKREIRGFVLTYFLISRLISSWNPSVFCQQELSWFGMVDLLCQHIEKDFPMRQPLPDVSYKKCDNKIVSTKCDNRLLQQIPAK